VDERLRSEWVRQIRDFLAGEWAPPVAEAPAIPDRGLQIAAVLLMVGVVKADLQSHHDEHRALEGALARVLDLGREEAGVLVRAAEEALGRGASLASVAQRIAVACTQAQKQSLLTSLWGIAYSDAELAGHEEYLVRKIAYRLDLSTADLVEAKVRAREEFLEEL